MPMPEYKVVFKVSGTRSEQIVRANSQSDAKKLIEAQYGSSVYIISVSRI